MTGYLSARGSNVGIGHHLRRGWRTVRDPLKMSRLRWLTLAWVIALGTVMLGAGFAIGGQRVINAKGVWAIYAHIPGGLHTHGVLLLGLGLGLVSALSSPLFGNPEPQRFLMMVMKATAWYYAWLWFSIMLAPLAVGGEFSYVGMVVWAMIAFMPGLLSVAPPPSLLPKNETELIRAALEVGLSARQAHALADGYFRPGGRRETQ